MRVEYVLGLLLFAGCDTPATSTSNEVVTKGEYVLAMSGDGISVPGYKLQGIDVETSWDEGTGSIYLGADKTKEPLGTLTMGGVVKSSNGTWYVNLATLSKSDVRVGTAEVLHARSYSAEEVTGVLSVRLSNVVVGANFIRAEIRGTFDRVLLHPEDLPERVYVAGSFTAMHN